MYEKINMAAYVSRANQNAYNVFVLQFFIWIGI